MMKTLRLTVVAFCYFLGPALALTNSPGCGKALPDGIKQGGTGSSNNFSITTSDGFHRSYLLHIPVAYTQSNAHGLIFSFHGRGEDAVNQEKLSRFSDPSINPDMLAVYPLGIKNEWQGDPDASTDDVGFTLDLLDKIANRYCIDTDRVFAAGKSNGGGFSANVLACDPVASTKIAAFGGIAGAYYQGHDVDSCDGATYPISCNPGRSPVPIFETHGEVDPVIAYNGGARRTRCLPSIPHFMTAWSKRNGLGTSNISTPLANGKVVKYEFGASKGLQGINTHYWISDLGHAWPDTQPNPDGCCSHINGSVLLMEFFKKYSLTGAVGSLASTSTASSASPASLTSSRSADSLSTAKATTTSTKPSSTAGSASTPGSSTSSVISTSTKTTTVSSAAAYPSPSCPSANNTIWTMPGSNNKFQVFCGFDTNTAFFGDPIYDLRNFGLCIQYCEKDLRCNHVAYNGACYLKTAKLNDLHTNGRSVTLYKTGNNVNRLAFRVT